MLSNPDNELLGPLVASHSWRATRMFISFFVTLCLCVKKARFFSRLWQIQNDNLRALCASGLRPLCG